MIPSNFDLVYQIMQPDVINHVRNDVQYYPGIYMIASKVLFCIYGAVDAEGRLLLKHVQHAVALFARDAQIDGCPTFESVARALEWMARLEVRKVPKLLHDFIVEVATHRAACIGRDQLTRLDRIMGDYSAAMRRGAH